MSTSDATDFLLNYLKKNHNPNLLNRDDWSALKKYKNHNGFLCRDFYNQKNDTKMLVVQKKVQEIKDETMFDVIPNENFLYYVNDVKMKPLYVYAPYLSNKGLTFKFALLSKLEYNIVTLGSDNLSEKLFQKLYEIFVKDAEKDKLFPVDRKVTFLIEDEMFFITNYATNEIIEMLELNNFRFSEKIFSCYYNGFYEKIYPDILDIKYQFPEDIGKDSDTAMDSLFNVVCSNNFNEENYTRSRKLLRKMTLEDLRVARKISMDLNIKESSRIKEMFQMEIKRRKINNFIFN